MKAEWGFPVAYAGEQIDVCCPCCNNEMSVWQNGCDIFVKMAHCVTCQLDFDITVKER